MSWGETVYSAPQGDGKKRHSKSLRQGDTTDLKAGGCAGAKMAGKVKGGRSWTMEIL